MNNKIAIDLSEMYALQCTSQVRNIILPFVDEICSGTTYTGRPTTTDQAFKTKPKQSIPKLYRNTGIVTMSLCIGGFFLMFADAAWPLLGLNSPVYIIWCLCCLSLFITNKIALAEWKSVNE